MRLLCLAIRYLGRQILPTHNPIIFVPKKKVPHRFEEGCPQKNACAVLKRLSLRLPLSPLVDVASATAAAAVHSRTHGRCVWSFLVYVWESIAPTFFVCNGVGKQTLSARRVTVGVLLTSFSCLFACRATSLELRPRFSVFSLFFLEKIVWNWGRLFSCSERVDPFIFARTLLGTSPVDLVWNSTLRYR